MCTSNERDMERDDELNSPSDMCRYDEVVLIKVTECANGGEGRDSVCCGECRMADNQGERGGRWDDGKCWSEKRSNSLGVCCFRG